MASLDPTRAKAQLRLAAQRLAQVRDRTDSQGHVLSRDIATLLNQRDTLLARAKAQRLIRDEIHGDMLEHLEMHLGVLSERITELDSRTPTPPVVEAAATVIYAAPYVNIKDLTAVRDMLGTALGAEFLQSATTNHDQLVSSKVIRALSAPPPSAAELDAYLLNIASTYNVSWEPELRADDVLRSISEILDKDGVAPTVDLPRLRRVCAHGIPSSPPFLRPRTWKLLLGTLPVLKSSWDKESMKSRANYYELVRRLLEPFAPLPPPAEPLHPLDAALHAATRDLFRVPSGLFAGLSEPPPPAPDCPLDAAAPPATRIPCARVLDRRLDAIHALHARAAPDKGADADSGDMPSISVTAPDGDGPAPEAAATDDDVDGPRAFSTGGAHARHASALVRLLYVHSALNPARRAPHLASLLLPLYGALQADVEPEHAEADAFWLFEALVGELGELEDDDAGAGRWMARFGERVGWADPELAADLNTKGLSPALPHYSYRWLAPLLTHTLPLPSVLSVWDALFARAPTTRAGAPKLDFLLDVCTAMLMRAKGPIARLGKAARPRSPGLWGEDSGYREPPSPVRAWELNDAFVEGMALLQQYPVAAAGGIESILQTAADLAARRAEEEERAARAPQGSLGARLRDTVWRGFTNQLASPAESPEASDDEEDEGETEASSTVDEGSETDRGATHSRTGSGFGAGIAGALWKGLGGPTQADAASPGPSSPLVTPSSPSSTTSSSGAPRTPGTEGASSLWSYAEKLRDSDTAAALAKASTNWRVKAMRAWNRPTQPQPPPPATSASKARSGSFSHSSAHGNGSDDSSSSRRSLPPRDPREVYSPPARPAFFRPPRDSWMPPARPSPLSSPKTPDVVLESDEAPRGRGVRESLASLAALAVAPKPPPSPNPEKRGPRPLLLDSSKLMTANSSRAPSRTPSRSPRPGHEHIRQDSMQSVSSVSGRASDAESDHTNGESRVVRLNRHSMSPMALAARHARMASLASDGSASTAPPVPPLPASFSRTASPSAMSNTVLRSPIGSSVASPVAGRSPVGSSPASRASSRGWAIADADDSPSSPPPPTPPAHGINVVTVSGSGDRNAVRVLEPPRKLSRKKTPPPVPAGGDTSDSSAPEANAISRSPSPRLRFKRQGAHLAHLTIVRDDAPPLSSSPQQSPGVASPSGATLAPPVWDEHEASVTPRAATFPRDGEDDGEGAPRTPVSPRARVRKTSSGAGTGATPRQRKASDDGASGRARKISGSRARKLSETRTVTARESGAEGDDEGYDDLLSAYESEDVDHH